MLLGTINLSPLFFYFGVIKFFSQFNNFIPDQRRFLKLKSTGGGFVPDDYQGHNQLPPKNLEHLFVDLSSTDLHLETSGHYAGNNGLDLSSVFTDDIDGTTRVDAWDIGADEGVTGTEELNPKVFSWAEVKPQ